MSGSRSSRLALLLLLLLAFALRAYRLDFQSFWGDEGSTAAMAGRGVADIVGRSANDISPPGYYLLYRGWAALVGNSEFASRFLSLAASVVTVALTYALARRLAGERAALIAALASALSAYALYYAQEARMYALLAALGVASWLAFLALGGRRPLRATLAYLLLSVTILFTQYFGIAILIAQNLAWLAATLWRRRWRAAHWLRWAAIQGAIGLLFLPWFLRIRETLLGWLATSLPVTPSFIITEFARLVTVGPTPTRIPLPLALPLALALLAGCLWGWRGKSSRSQVTIPLPPATTLPNISPFIALVPPLLMLLISQERPFWNPKFLLIALPGFHLLVGQGTEALARWMPDRPLKSLIAPLVAALLIVLSIRPLNALYFDPTTWRDDYRTIAHTIAAQAGPEDAVLLVGPGQVEIYDYYADPSIARFPLPASRPLVPQQAEGALQAISQVHPRLFVIWWAEQESDPGAFIPRWLDRHAFPLGSRWYGNVRLETFATTGPQTQESLDIIFPDSGSVLHLTAAGTTPETVKAGEEIAIESTWQGDGLLPPLTLFAQLLDAGGNVIGQYDGQGGIPASDSWEGEKQVAHMGIPVPVGTPPGDYALIVGAYRTDSGTRLLPDSGGDAYRLATIHVTRPATPPSLAALALAYGEQRSAPFGDLMLVGAAANRLGDDHAPETPLAPGDALAVRLAWQSQRDAPSTPPLWLRLRHADGTVAAEWPWQPTEQRHPLAAWQRSELVRDPQRRTLPDTLEPGRYLLTLESNSQRVTIRPLQIQLSAPP